MTIEVGKTYMTRARKPVLIVMQTDIFTTNHDLHRPYLGDNGVRYTASGNANWMRTQGQTMSDLMEEVNDTPAYFAINIPSVDSDISVAGSLIGSLVLIVGILTARYYGTRI